MRKIFILFAVVLFAGSMTMKAENEIYAVLNETDSTMTLRYDDQREANSGVADWMTDDFKAKTAIVVLDESMKDALPTTTQNWFSNFEKLKEIQHLDFLNTSEVTTMRSMFYGCKRITSLDVSHFNTEKVANMRSVFAICGNLALLDVSNFKTDNDTTMELMFYWCENLKSLDLSNFNTSKVQNMKNMFYGCERLTSLNVSSFDTHNVTTMYNMFGQCSSLTSLDIRNFDISGATNLRQMFTGMSNITTIYCNGNWSGSTAAAESGFMFGSSIHPLTHLVGGNGTVWTKEYTDAFYARPDKDGQPGYFTWKDIETAIDNQQSEIKNQKLLKDGQILILRGDRTYTLTGQEVK